MGRMYSVGFAPTAQTGAVDAFEVTPADDKPVRVAGLWLYQTTDLGDSEEEVLTVVVKRGNTTSGSGGAAGTIEVVGPSGAAAGFTVEVRNTTQASAGTEDELFRDGWNIRIPYQVIFPEDMRPGASQTHTTLVVEVSAPTDSVTWGGCLMIEEMG